MEEEIVKPERSKGKGLRILLVSVLVLAPAVYFGANRIGVEMDRKEKVPHANCEVFDKSETVGTGLHLIKTSCGDYEATDNMHGFLKVGTKYDMQVTKGNWARNPRLAYAEGNCGCKKSSPQPAPSQSPAPVPSQKPTPFPNPTKESELPGFTGGGGGKDA